MDNLYYYIIIFAVAILVLFKLKLLIGIFLAPMLKQLGRSDALSGPGGHRYITDMKQELATFSHADLSSLIEGRYDKSVNFRTAGIITDYKDNKSLLSFYGDFASPKDDTVRYNKLIGSLKAITAKDELEIMAEKNSFKLTYNNLSVASFIANTRRILDKENKEIGFIQGPEYENLIETSDVKPREIIINGNTIARYTGLFFTIQENKKVFLGKPVFEFLKSNLTPFEQRLIVLLVMLDIYYILAYLSEKK